MDKATLDIIKKAVADSKKKENDIAMTTAPSKAAALSSSSGYSTADVQNWFTEQRARKKKTGETYLTKGELEILKKVVDHICAQLHAEAHDEHFEPLLRLMHGGPGVGKSEVLKALKQLFTDFFHWAPGREFQTAALQAVMAEQLGGETLHHSCGIGIAGKKNAGDTTNPTNRQMAVAK